MEYKTLKDGYERYKGCFIEETEKIVFGKPRPMFLVTSLDTIIFHSGSLEKCHQFCDEFYDKVLTKI